MLLAESQKSTRKVPENRKKNAENLTGNRKMPFLSHGKLKKKKNAESRKRHIFSAESWKQTPIPSPH